MVTAQVPMKYVISCPVRRPHWSALNLYVLGTIWIQSGLCMLLHSSSLSQVEWQHKGGFPQLPMNGSQGAYMKTERHLLMWSCSSSNIWKTMEDLPLYLRKRTGEQLMLVSASNGANGWRILTILCSWVTVIRYIKQMWMSHETALRVVYPSSSSHWRLIKIG